MLVRVWGGVGVGRFGEGDGGGGKGCGGSQQEVIVEEVVRSYGAGSAQLELELE